MTCCFTNLEFGNALVNVVFLDAFWQSARDEINSWQLGFIADAQLAKLAEPLNKHDYGKYLLDPLTLGRDPHVQIVQI